MKRLTDPTFRYTPAAATDIRKTFARIKKEQAKEAQERLDKIIRMPAKGAK